MKKFEDKNLAPKAIQAKEKPTESKYNVENQAGVYYFTGSDFSGLQESWISNDTSTDHLDGRYSGGNSDFNHTISSMVVMKGECQTTTDAGGTMTGPEESMCYYQANKGENNQGVYASLGNYNNKFTALRVQHPEILRQTSVPYLILRDATGMSSANAKILTDNTPGMAPFKLRFALVVGSSSGYWDLFEYENYVGRYIRVYVNGGSYCLGDYGFKDDQFDILSARYADMLPPEAWVQFNPKDTATYFIENQLGVDTDIQITTEHGTNHVNIKNGGLQDFSINNDMPGQGAFLSWGGYKVSKISLSNGGNGNVIKINSSINTLEYISFDNTHTNIIDFEKSVFLNGLYDKNGLSNHTEIGDINLAQVLSSKYNLKLVIKPAE